MRKRYVLWLIAGVLVLGSLILLVPGSPAYAPTLFARYAHVHFGHGVGYWTDALNDPDQKVRHRAIYALGMMGEDAGEAAPSLAAIMLDDPDSDIRSAAALALSKMAPASRSVVPALARALDDDDALVRMNAANALLRLRRDARPAVPALIQAMREKRNESNAGRFTVSIQETVTLALGHASAGSDEGVPALLEALDRPPNDSVLYSAIQALGDVGPEARAALPRLRELANDSNPAISGLAREAIRKIGE
jgi:HEAT repeat protein